MEDFYKILGVNENATQDEIKKTYRKLAVEHHPDKGGDENTFKRISEAYDTIGDENKRNQYDNQRKNPFANGGGFDPFGGGGFNPFGDMFANMQHRQRKRAVPDKIIEITLGAIESFNAGEKNIVYSRNHKCGGCNGEGGEKSVCSNCGGKGITTHQIGTGLFTQIIQQPCNSCGGRGFSYKTTCGTCHGATTTSSMETINIKLPHGIDDGQFLKVQGKGDYRDGMYGNLVIKVKIQPENNFEKSLDDLIYNAYFDLTTIKSDKVMIPHPLGEISIKLPEEFDTSKPLRVKGKGYHNRGDLYIKLFVKFKR
jgi:molecular chaperone DnaJ